MRFLKISFVLSKNLVFHPLTKRRKDNFGTRLRYSCEELGISFIKIGQILSMRYDLLSEENCLALQQLLDKANSIEFKEIEKILEKEYGRPHSKIFKKIYEDPVGSASVSQVHKAELFTGETVAIKIKRPSVDKHLKADLHTMKKITRIGLIFSKDLRGFRAMEVVKLFEKWIHQDVDFRLEIENIKKFKEQDMKNKKKPGNLVHLDVYEELCTDNIIVMNFIDGITVKNKNEILAKKNYNIEKSVRTYVNYAVQSWFRTDIKHFLFQADPHLSNIIALPNGAVANIDCGLILSLTKKEMDTCKNLLLAIYLKDSRTIIRIISEMENGDFTEYKKKLENDIENYFEKIDNKGIGFWFFELTKMLVKHKIKYPSYLITIGRANIILDGLVERYFPEHTALDILGDQLREHAMKHIQTKMFSEQNLMRIGHAFTQKILREEI